MSFQPLSLVARPPRRTTINAMITTPSSTTARDIRKPTDRHILQK